MAYQASTYVKNKVNELGGAWYIYIDANLVDGDTVITSGESILSGDSATWDGSTNVQGVYTNITLMNTSAIGNVNRVIIGKITDVTNLFIFDSTN